MREVSCNSKVILYAKEAIQESYRTSSDQEQPQAKSQYYYLLYNSGAHNTKIVKQQHSHWCRLTQNGAVSPRPLPLWLLQLSSQHRQYFNTKQIEDAATGWLQSLTPNPPGFLPFRTDLNNPPPGTVWRMGLWHSKHSSIWGRLSRGCSIACHYSMKVRPQGIAPKGPTEWIKSDCLELEVLRYRNGHHWN